LKFQPALIYQAEGCFAWAKGLTKPRENPPQDAAQSARSNSPSVLKDARQDDKLDDLQTWRQNLESYNEEEGKKVQELSEDLSAIRGIGIGAMSCPEFFRLRRSSCS
jgi:hypothetical protein